MKKFEELHLDDQIQMLISAIEALAEADCSSFPQLAAARDRSANELWRELCADTGLDECAPWDGWPSTPRKLPDPPRHQVRDLDKPTDVPE